MKSVLLRMLLTSSILSADHPFFCLPINWLPNRWPDPFYLSKKHKCAIFSHKYFHRVTTSHTFSAWFQFQTIKSFEIFVFFCVNRHLCAEFREIRIGFCMCAIFLKHSLNGPMSSTKKKKNTKSLISIYWMQMNALAIFYRIRVLNWQTRQLIDPYFWPNLIRSKWIVWQL